MKLKHVQKKTKDWDFYILGICLFGEVQQNHHIFWGFRVFFSVLEPKNTVANCDFLGMILDCPGDLVRDLCHKPMEK